MSVFMGVVVDGLIRLGDPPEFITAVRAGLDEVAAGNPALRNQYIDAVDRRDALALDRILLICQQKLDDADDLWIGNLRINGLTKRLFIGTGRSTPLFVD